MGNIILAIINLLTGSKTNTQVQETKGDKGDPGPVGPQGPPGPPCTEVNEFKNDIVKALDLHKSFVLEKLNNVNNNIDLLKTNILSSISNQNSETLKNILNGVSLFQLTEDPNNTGRYYYKLIPNVNLPSDLSISYSFNFISGPNTQPIISKCQFVWEDGNGGEVIRNFDCFVYESELIIVNQDNDTFNNSDNTLIQPGFTPVRLKGEGFFGINVIAKIGNSYTHTEMIPVCVSGDPKYQPVGGAVNDLSNKIIASGFPTILQDS